MKNHPWYDPDVCDPEDFPSAKTSRNGFPWIRVLLALFLLLVIAISCTSCATTTIYADGKPIARFQGNMTDLVFTRTAKGKITWTAKSVSHSTATLAGGRAISAVTIPAASVLTADHLLSR